LLNNSPLDYFMISAIEAEKVNDNELIKLVLTDQENFLYVVSRYKTKLFYYIKRISGLDEEEINDVLQNIFIKVYTNLNDFDHNLKFSSWIYRITHNEVIDNYRKTKARPQLADPEFNEDVLKEIADDFQVAEAMDKQLLKEKIALALDKLDLKLKEVLVLKFLEDKDYKEISDIIKKPLGTVASRINKAKLELKKELAKIKYD